MFIYVVYKVAPSTAPIYRNQVRSKLIKLGSVKATNSNNACCLVGTKLGLDGSDAELYAHQVYNLG